jgi:hypothetical protein
MRRSSKKLPKDPNLLAYEIVRISTEEPEPAQEEPRKKRSPVSKYLAEIGRKGGLKGGKARAAKLTPEQRQEAARKAAKARWSKK